VFEGGGYGVAVTAAPVVLPPWPVEMPPLGVDGSPVRLGQLMPVIRRTPTQKALELERIARAESQLAAYKIEVVAGLARDRASDTAPDDDPLPGVDEFFPDELALTLNCSGPRRPRWPRSRSRWSSACRRPGRRSPTGSWTGPAPGRWPRS
jgi:hypothetical protein